MVNSDEIVFSAPNQGSNEDSMNKIRLFRDALGQFCTGVVAITSVDNNGFNIGITVNSFSSLSLTPPLILWSLSETSESFQNFLYGDNFIVNILAREQENIATKFSISGKNKFNGIETSLNENNLPIINGCMAYLECEVYNRITGGDHDIIVGEVKKFCSKKKRPLVFFNGKYSSIS